MWFGFGLITAIFAFVFALRTRQQARWRGDSLRLGDPTRLAYEYSVQKSKKGDITQVRIGVTAPAGLHFRLREEGTHDIFFKRLGVCEEMQTSDPAFDQRLYLEADAIALGYVLRRHSSLRNSILRIFDVAHRLDLRRCRLRCMGTRLWVEFEPRDHTGLGDAQRELVPELRAVADGLQHARLDADSAHDPFIWRAAALLAISTAAAVLGGLGVVRGLAGRTDILEPGKLFMACVPLGLIFAAAFCLLVVVYLGRSSRAHLVLIEAALVGSFGFVTATFALAREANIEFDSSSVQQHELQPTRVEHRIRRSRRGRERHSYYLHTMDWRPGRSAQYLKITIDRSTFERLNGQGGAIAVTRKGALGYEWVERFDAPAAQ